ncbi:MAG: FAD-dependent oxidoreductase [Acidobacteriota bacterium]|nr:FAD-dependent oxidoreductase [Acidobacteriota bacterium]MDQ4123038.1 FAD-dependent oxidoreductase [Acidobacteriota bacterium]
MKQNPKKPVVIVGGGIAGLTAANFLRRQNVPVRLFEAGKQLAGLAQSFHDADGFTYDFGAHFLTNRLAAAVGIGANCRDVPRYGEAVWLDGKNYGYPFGLLRVPRFAASGARTQIKNFVSKEKTESAEEWFRSKYGRALADEVAVPLTEAWSGASGKELSLSVGDSIPGSIAGTLFLKVAGKLTGRAVACGYSREMPEKPSVWHVYPENGIATLCHKLAENLEDAIELESSVEAIYVEDEQVAGVRAAGRDIEAAAVVSTAPVHVLPKLIKGSDKLNYLNRFRYRPMVFVNMRFEGRGLLRDVVVWTPEKRFPFFRLTETPLSMPWLAPEGKTLITVDIGCEKDDEIWQMADDKLGELCLENLMPIVKDAKERYRGCRVLRTPLAYPIFLREYEADRKRFEQGTGIENLYSVGRNGEFSHIFMEDVYWRTLRKMRELMETLCRQNDEQPERDEAQIILENALSI